MSDASYTQVTGKLDCNKCVWGTRDGGCASWECEFIDRDDAVKAWRNMPSVEPEKAKRGFWYTIEKGDKGYSAGDFRCSVCNEPNHTWIPKPNYCPNCGADMRGEQE